MSSLTRAILFLAVVVGLGGVIFFVSRGDPSASRSLQVQAPPADAVASAQPDAARAEPRERAPTAPAVQPAPATREELTEDALTASVHALEDSNPARALELARQGLASWPDGPRAPELAAAEVKCLYRLGRPSEGRGAAEAMVNKYPTSPWALEVEKQTGAHPYVNH